MRPVSVAAAFALARALAAPVAARPASPVIPSQAPRAGRRARMASVSAASRAICAWSLVCESSAPAIARALCAV